MADFPKLNVAENLKRLMEERFLTISMTASRAGINKSTLHNYIYGVSPQGVVTLEKLATFFKVPLNEILYGKDESTPVDNSKVPAHLKNGTYEVTIRYKGEITEN